MVEQAVAIAAGRGLGQRAVEVVAPLRQRVGERAGGRRRHAADGLRAAIGARQRGGAREVAGGGVVRFDDGVDIGAGDRDRVSPARLAAGLGQRVGVAVVRRQLGSAGNGVVRFADVVSVLAAA